MRLKVSQIDCSITADTVGQKPNLGAKARAQEPVFWGVSWHTNFFRGWSLTLQQKPKITWYRNFFQTFLFIFCFFFYFQNEVTETRGEKNGGRWFLVLASGLGPPTWTHFLRPWAKESKIVFENRKKNIFRERQMPVSVIVGPHTINQKSLGRFTGTYFFSFFLLRSVIAAIALSWRHWLVAD